MNVDCCLMWMAFPRINRTGTFATFTLDVAGRSIADEDFELMEPDLKQLMKTCTTIGTSRDLSFLESKKMSILAWQGRFAVWIAVRLVGTCVAGRRGVHGWTRDRGSREKNYRSDIRWFIRRAAFRLIWIRHERRRSQRDKVGLWMDQSPFPSSVNSLKPETGECFTRWLFAIIPIVEPYGSSHWTVLRKAHWMFHF